MMDHRRPNRPRYRVGEPSLGRSTRPPSRVPFQAPREPHSSHARSGIDPFELFCAYHLGIAADRTYKPANIHDVARRLGVDSGVIRQALQAHGMDPETMLNVDFDLTMAQLDIQVAPEGVDRVELAKGIFEEFRAAPRKKRDWQKMLAEDARENSKTFGRR